MKYHCYVDESGIHKKVDYSVFCVVYINAESIEALNQSMISIERQLKISSFHWSDLPWKLRLAVLEQIRQFPFEAKIALYRNPINTQIALEWSLQHLLVERNIQNVIIDGKKPRWVERRLKKVLRDKGLSVNKLRTVRRESTAGVRIADAIAGTVRAYHDSHSQRAKNARRLIKNKITTQLLGGQVGR